MKYNSGKYHLPFLWRGARHYWLLRRLRLEIIIHHSREMQQPKAAARRQIADGSVLPCLLSSVPFDRGLHPVIYIGC